MISQQQQAASSVEQCDAAGIAIDVSEMDIRQDRIVAKTTIDNTRNEEVVTVVREYDTNQPIDATTGLPPLKSELTQSRRTIDAQTGHLMVEQSSEHAQRTDTNIRAEQTEQRIEHTDVLTQIDTKESRGLNPAQQALCAIGAMVIVGVILWIVIKIFKPF